LHGCSSSFLTTGARHSSKPSHSSAISATASRIFTAHNRPRPYYYGKGVRRVLKKKKGAQPPSGKTARQICAAVRAYFLPKTPAPAALCFGLASSGLGK
jgi:hypothetical protein